MLAGCDRLRDIWQTIGDRRGDPAVGEGRTGADGEYRRIVQ